jgi:hypothetical protein
LQAPSARPRAPRHIRDQRLHPARAPFLFSVGFI